MKRIPSRILSVVVACAAAAGGVAAQDGGAEPDQRPAASADQQPGQAPEAAPARRALPRITGTVVRWNGNRIDLKTSEGETKVAVNRDTERLAEIAPGAEVTVEYRRKISGFVIAERVLPAEAGEAAASAAAASAAAKAPTVTGNVASWNDAALVLDTEEGAVTLFLSPQTSYEVKALPPGLPVTVEYEQLRDQARLATRVRAAGEQSGSEPASPAPADKKDG